MANVTILTNTTGGSPRLIGQTIVSTVTIEVTGSPTADDVDIRIPIPLNPLGTTRTWTATAPFPLATSSGTGAIAQIEDLTDAGPVIYTINDTVTAEGTYQLIGTIRGPNVSGGIVESGSDEIIVIATNANPTISKETFGLTTRKAGDVIFSDLSFRNQGAITNGLTIQSGNFTGNTPQMGYTTTAGTTSWVGRLKFDVPSTIVSQTFTVPIGKEIILNWEASGTKTGATVEIVDGTTTKSAPLTQRAMAMPSNTSGSATVRFLNGAGTATVGLTFASVTTTDPAVAFGINVLDPIPIQPSGTTRTWISTGSTGSGSALSGTGEINETVDIMPSSTLNYEIKDTVNNPGVYKNTGEMTGALIKTSSLNASGKEVVIKESCAAPNQVDVEAILCRPLNDAEKSKFNYILQDVQGKIKDMLCYDPFEDEFTGEREFVFSDTLDHYVLPPFTQLTSLVVADCNTQTTQDIDCEWTTRNYNNRLTSPLDCSNGLVRCSCDRCSTLSCCTSGCLKLKVTATWNPCACVSELKNLIANIVAQEVRCDQCNDDDGRPVTSKTIRSMSVTYGDREIVDFYEKYSSLLNRLSICNADVLG